MRLFLSGPISGIAHNNGPMFARVEAALQDLGYQDIFSPPFEVPPHASYREAMQACLEWMCARAEGFVSLPGWSDSPGARAENALAQALGLPMWDLRWDHVGFLFLPASVPGNPAKGPLLQRVGQARPMVAQGGWMR